MLQRILGGLLIAVLLCSCIDEDTSPIPASAGSFDAVSDVTLTPVPSTVTPVIAQVLVQPSAAVSTNVPETTPTPYSIQLEPNALRLQGKLIFTDYDLGLAKLDVTRNTITPIFQPLHNGLVSAASLSPDGKTFLLAYSPPPSLDSVQFGFTQIYTMPADTSSDPVVLIDEPGEIQLYFSPFWAPDGNSVYFERYLSKQDPTSGQPEYAAGRVDFPSSAPGQPVLHDVFNAAISSDGKRLVYAVLDPTNFSNDLYISHSDGTNPRLVLPKNTFQALDVSIFTPDGKAIIFAAAGNGPGAGRSWTDEFVARHLNLKRHSIPEDLWRVSLLDGRLQRLTQLGTFGYFPSFSPDGAHIAFSAVDGIYMMAADGGNLTKIYDQTTNGTLQWVP